MVKLLDGPFKANRSNVACNAKLSAKELVPVSAQAQAAEMQGAHVGACDFL